MGFFGKRSAADGEELPSLKGAPRRLRRTLLAAGDRTAFAINTAARQGRPVQQASLHERACAVNLFWRFLESELSNQGLGTMQRLQTDVRLSEGAQALHDWLAIQCDIRPTTANCVAWADQFNKDAAVASAWEHLDEPDWKGRAQGPAFFAAVADDASGGPCVDGVLELLGSSFKLTVAGAASGAAFAADAVREVREEADGYRLEIGPPCPYSSVLVLDASGKAALSASLRRAGLHP